MLYSPEPDLELQLYFPNGTAVEMADHQLDGSWLSDDGGDEVGAVGWRFTEPTRGWWTALVKSRSGKPLHKKKDSKSNVEAYLLIWNDSKERLFSHLGTYWWNTGRQVGVTSNLFALKDEGVERGVRPQVLASAIVSQAMLDIVSPSGQETFAKMTDDGDVRRMLLFCVFFFFLFFHSPSRPLIILLTTVFMEASSLWKKRECTVSPPCSRELWKMEPHSRDLPSMPCTL
jgi:hypothetical protein